jgi:hypothetical protein
MSGRRLVLARAAWVTLAVLISAFFLANLPVYFTQLHTVCLHPPCARWQLTPASAHELGPLYLSPDGYALASLVLSVSSVLVWFAVAAVIAWRQSRQWLALLTSLLLIAQSVSTMSGTPVAPLHYSAPVWHLVTLSVGMLSLTLFLLVFTLFPTGRFVPGWMCWGVVVVPAVLWAYASIVPSLVSSELVLNLLSVSFLSAVVASIIGAQIYRYRRVSTPVERQQTKWVLLSLIESFPLTGLYYFLPVFFPAISQPDSLYFLVAKSAYTVLWLFVPLCFGIAILRYRLWDIDVLIRRALVYGTLSTILAALYFGVVVGLQTLVGSVNSAAASYPVIIVATTLLIAALFNPLRHRIQAFIDQRFYRHKYDAAKTLAAFSATLRNDVELAEVREQLVAVVQETMQPAHASLWLSTPARQAEPSHELPRRVPPLLSSSGVFAKPVLPEIPSDGVSL